MIENVQNLQQSTPNINPVSAVELKGEKIEGNEQKNDLETAGILNISKEGENSLEVSRTINGLEVKESKNVEENAETTNELEKSPVVYEPVEKDAPIIDMDIKLYDFTQVELQQLVADGKITQTDMNNELQRRQNVSRETVLKYTGAEETEVKAQDELSNQVE